MDKQTASFWVDVITELLTDRELFTVSITPSGVDVRQHQEFNKAYIVEYKDDLCSIGLSDTYGVMSGSTDWRIDPAKRSITARTINGYGELCQFLWVIVDDGQRSDLYIRMSNAQKKSWKFAYEAVSKPE